MSNQSVQDNSSPLKYFSAVMHIADDDLDPYEMRLYVHYIRVAGQSQNGACWESIRTTAKNTKMSVGKATTTRNRLVDLGYIECTRSDDQNETYAIVIVDRWEENITRCKAKCSPHEQGVHHMNTQQVQGCSPHEPKKNIKTSEDKKILPAATPQGSEPTTKPRNAMYDAIQSVFGFEGAMNGKFRKWLEGTATRKDGNAYFSANMEVAVTPAELLAWWAWYCKEQPNPEYRVKEVAKIQESILAYRRSLQSRPVVKATIAPTRVTRYFVNEVEVTPDANGVVEVNGRKLIPSWVRHLVNNEIHMKF